MILTQEKIEKFLQEGYGIKTDKPVVNLEKEVLISIMQNIFMVGKNRKEKHG